MKQVNRCKHGVYSKWFRCTKCEDEISPSDKIITSICKKQPPNLS